MNINQLLSIKPNTTLLVKNDPFDYKGRAEITLEGNQIIHWFFSEEGAFISANQDTDEMIYFFPAEGEVNTDEDGAVFDGEPFELSAEDKGKVSAIFDETTVETGDIINFTDYENSEGDLVRAQENESTGENQVFTGAVLVEEEVMIVED